MARVYMVLCKGGTTGDSVTGSGQRGSSPKRDALRKAAKYDRFYTDCGPHRVKLVK